MTEKHKAWFLRRISLLFTNLVEDRYRYYLQMVVIPMFLGFTSLIMCIMNIFTDKRNLMCATAIFAIISLVNTLITLLIKRETLFTRLMFETSILALFTYFLISGEAMGFSPIWICILPCCGILLLGKKHGIIVNIIMFAIVIFFLCTPEGHSLQQFKFSEEFNMRFPVLYVCFFAIGLFFEELRGATSRELQKAREKYQTLSSIDFLTRIPNRQWFNEEVIKLIGNPEKHLPIGMMIIDIDKFKLINDNYGHLFGDKVLINAADLLKNNLRRDDYLCRWGGEEFLILLGNCSRDALLQKSEYLRNKIASMTTTDSSGNPVSITVSIGAVHIPDSSIANANELFKAADNSLYLAKANGRNRVILSP